MEPDEEEPGAGPQDEGPHGHGADADDALPPGDGAASGDDADPREVAELEAAVHLKQGRLRGLLRRMGEARARRPQLPDGAALDAALARMTAAAAAAAGAPHEASPTTDGAVAASGAALEAATTPAVAGATAWVDAHHPLDDDGLLAQRARRAASLIGSTSRGMARRVAEVEDRRGAAPGGRPCARCRQRSHKTGAATCPATAVGGDKNPHAYDRGEDPAASDPYACRATGTSSVMVPVAAVLRTLPASPDGTAHAVVRGGFLATAEHHTQLHFTLTLVWLNTVHTLFGAVKADGWAAALPGPAGWGEYWNWVAYAVCCRGAHGGSLPAGVKCGSCGRARDNTLCGPAARRLSVSYPALMDATRNAMDALASSFDAACHDHLPHGNSHARWRGVVTTIVTHTARTVAVATRRLAWRVATMVVDAADAPASGEEQRGRRRAAVYAAARSCLERGSDAPHAAHAAKLDALPPDVRAAALREIADARVRAQPAPVQGTPPLFPTGGAHVVARRWAEYIPYLLHVQAEGVVDKPFSLVPGKAATLHGYGTVTKARLGPLIRRAWPAHRELYEDVRRRGAAAIAGLLGLETARCTSGADLRSNGEGVVFTLSRPATAAEAEAADVAAVTRKANGSRVQSRVQGSPTTQLEKQGFPIAAVKTLTVVSADPGKATVLTAVSSGPTAAAWGDRPWVRRRRLARSRLVAADALTRAALALDAVVWRAAAASAGAKIGRAHV